MIDLLRMLQPKIGVATESHGSEYKPITVHQEPRFSGIHLNHDAQPWPIRFFLYDR